MVKKGLKYIFILLSGLLIVMLFAFILTQTPWFKKQITKHVEKLAASNLNGELQIKSLKGNFYNSLEINDVSFSENGKTIASFSTLKLKYNLLALLKKQIFIDTIRLTSPTFSLWQNPDSSWNFQNIIARSVEKKDTTTTSLFPFEIEIPYLSIQNGTLKSSTFIDLIPTSTDYFNLLANGSYAAEKLRVHLQSLNFQTTEPSLTVKEISTFFNIENSRMAVDSFILRTDRSNIFIDGEYKSLQGLEANIDTDPLDKEDFAIFIPGFKLACSPQIKSFFKSENDTTLVRVQLLNKNQSIEIDVKLSTLEKALQTKNTLLPFSTSIKLKGVVPENWIETKNTNSTFNGKVDLKGNNLLDLKSTIQVKANLKNSVYLENKFSTLLVNGKYKNNNASANLEIESTQGKVKIDGEILKIKTKLPSYRATLVAKELNLTSLIPELEGTFLNANIRAEGSGFTENTMNVRADADLYNSTLYNFTTDSAKIQVQFANNKIVIDTVNARLNGANLLGSGTFEIPNLYLLAQAQLDADSLNFLSHYLSLPIEFSKLQTNAKIDGQVSRLEFSGNLIVKNVDAYSLQSDSLTGTYSGLIKEDSIMVATKIGTQNLITGPIEWDTIFTDVKYQQNQVEATVYANWKDTLNANLKTTIQFEDGLHITLPHFKVKTMVSDYYLNDSLQSISLDSSSINVDKLWIKDYNQPEFNLKLSGNLNTEKVGRLQLNIENFNLKEINKILQLEDSVHGIITANLNVSGTAENPVAEGDVEIENPGYGSFQLQKFSSQLTYNNQNGKINFLIPELKSTGFIQAPIEISLDSSRLKFTPPKTFNAGFSIDSLFLSQEFSNMLSGTEVSGNVDVEINANGPIKAPLFYGSIKIDEGKIFNSTYGITYNKIYTKLGIEGSKIDFDTLLIKQDKGYFTAHGVVDFDSTIINGNVKHTTLVASAKNFNVVNSRNYKLKIDANTFLRMSDKSPEFGGEVNVITSDLFLPALLSDEMVSDETVDDPLLVQALAKSSETTNIKATKIIPEDEKKIRSDFRNNLTGRMKVVIPRNTWIRSNDMNLELRGELDLVKKGPYFELFGNVNVNRGHYILYGRKLLMQESEIIFQGGIDLDPTLNIIAEHTFRDASKTKRKLKLLVSGLLSEPEINFTLDDNPTSESEAVSVLVFGKTSDELNGNNQNSLVGSVGSNMVAKVLTSQLSKTLGATLNLDMIEITSTENWQSAALVIGKYITNNLFVTYQRGFGETEDDEITPETVSLEYELNRIFFLHLKSGSALTSGIDVVLKLEQKKKK